MDIGRANKIKGRNRERDRERKKRELDREI